MRYLLFFDMHMFFLLPYNIMAINFIFLCFFPCILGTNELCFTTPILSQTVNSEFIQHNDKVYKLTATKSVAFEMNLHRILSVYSFNFKCDIVTNYRSVNDFCMYFEECIRCFLL